MENPLTMQASILSSSNPLYQSYIINPLTITHRTSNPPLSKLNPLYRTYYADPVEESITHTPNPLFQDNVLNYGELPLFNDGIVLSTQDFAPEEIVQIPITPKRPHVVVHTHSGDVQVMDTIYEAEELTPLL